MNPSHEKLLTNIVEEFPEEVAEATHQIEDHPDVKPPVAEEYLYKLCAGDEVLIDLCDQMIAYFYRYTRDVCEQESLIRAGRSENQEEIARRDKARTILHDAMIDSVKILARNLGEKNRESGWIDPIDRGGRAGYARLAILTTFLDIIKRAKQK